MTQLKTDNLKIENSFPC